MFKELFTEQNYTHYTHYTHDNLNQQIFEGLKADGTCYEDAYQYISKNPEATLVHGLVVGQGPIEGVLYNHAWIEKGNRVIDPSLKPALTVPKELYYKLGRIDTKTVYRYDHSEFLEKVLEHETYGPWETVLLKNKY